MPWKLKDTTVFPEALVEHFDREEVKMNKVLRKKEAPTPETQTMMEGATVKNFDVSIIWPCTVVDPETFEALFHAPPVTDCRVHFR